MILELPKERKKIDKTEWHKFWCLRPRIIEHNLVWLSRAERRFVGERELFDGASEMPYIEKVWEYRLIHWVVFP